MSKVKVKVIERSKITFSAISPEGSIIESHG
jgi:hypothetical protein